MTGAALPTSPLRLTPNPATRQIVFDTETTGLEPELLGHRIIEIGAIELVNCRRTGRQFHRYLCPDRTIDPGAVQVHGLTTESSQLASRTSPTSSTNCASSWRGPS